MIDVENIEQKLAVIQYVKIDTADDVFKLSTLYKELGWVSSSNKTIEASLDYCLRNEFDFPILLEYNNNFSWKEIGSYLSTHGRVERKLPIYTNPLLWDQGFHERNVQPLEEGK
jgi:hypothetical protein